LPNTKLPEDINEQLELFKLQSTVNPQKENGHMQLNNEIIESLCKVSYKSTFTLPIILTVIRKTWGWNKKYDAISLSQLEDATGFTKRNVLNAVKEAQSYNIIISINMTH